MQNFTKEALRKRLNEFIVAPLSIKTQYINCHSAKTFESCLKYCCQPQEDPDIIFKIESVLDYLHEELNTGHWSTVPIETRQNFSTASFVKALSLIQSCSNLSNDVLNQSLKALDMGLLLGAPLDDNPDLLTESAKHLSQYLTLENTFNLGKRKLESDVNNSECQIKLDELPGIEIEELTVPSVEAFNNAYFTPQVPVKLKGCMSHWPAVTKWQDVNYLLKVAGNRTVPVELGSHYTDENWSQKLMTLKEFISKHYLQESGSDLGYLAQHNLFDQITELKEDVRIPEYCCCSLNYDEATDPDINAWLGPKGTVSPLHQDPKNNILAQVYGSKRIILYSPDDSDYLYPHQEAMLTNTARVNPLYPQYDEFPKFRQAKMFKCLLKPGEMLFIPMKWWHHVTAFEKSFSVSFWWQ